MYEKNEGPSNAANVVGPDEETGKQEFITTVATSNEQVRFAIANIPHVRHGGRHTRETLAWAELCDRLTKHARVKSKAGVRLWCPFTFAGDMRANDKAETARVLVLDFDGPDPASKNPKARNRLWTDLDHIVTAVGAFEGVVHTSHSNADGKPKHRVVLLLSRPVDRHEYKRLYRWVIAKLVGHNRHDETAEHATQFFYLPSCTPGATPHFRRLGSRLLDVDSILSKVPPDDVGGKPHAPAGAVSKAFRTLRAIGWTMRRNPKREGAWFLACPWADGHTERKNFDDDAGTMIFESGGFSCKHNFCVDHDAEALKTWLHDNHPDEWLAAAGATAPAKGARAFTVGAPGELEYPEHVGEILLAGYRGGYEALRAGGGSLHVRTTPGSGKTRFGAAFLLERAGKYGGPEQPSLRAHYAAPLHRLCEEVDASHIGVWATSSHPVSPSHRSSACKDRKRLKRYEGLPIASKVGCDGCRFRKDFEGDGSGAACPAYKAASADPLQPVQLRTHATLANNLNQAQPGEVFFKDEQAPLVLDAANNSPVADAFEGMLPCFPDDWHEPLREVAGSLRGVLAACASRETLRRALMGGESLQTALPTLAGESPGSRADRLTEFLTTLGAALEGGHTYLYKRAAHLPREALDALRAAFPVLRVLCEAAHRPCEPAFFFHPEKRDVGGRPVAAGGHWVATRHPWLRAYDNANRRGVYVIVVSATLRDEQIRSVVPVYYETIRIDVQDSLRVRRVLLRPRKLSRRSFELSGFRDAAAYLREAVGHFRVAFPDVRGRELVVATFQSVEERIAAELRKAREGGFHDRNLEPLAALEREGCKVTLCHYYGLAGLDHMKDADAIVTLGLPTPNLYAVEREAALFGLDADELARRTAAEELVQAWGRLRPVHRTKPGLIMHGAPDTHPIDLELAPQWQGVTHPGAPSRGSRLTLAEKRECLEALRRDPVTHVRIHLLVNRGIDVSVRRLQELAAEAGIVPPRTRGSQTTLVHENATPIKEGELSSSVSGRRPQSMGSCRPSRPVPSTSG